jgi:hypothetical protein
MNVMSWWRFRGLIYKAGRWNLDTPLTADRSRIAGSIRRHVGHRKAPIRGWPLVAGQWTVKCPRLSPLARWVESLSSQGLLADDRRSNDLDGVTSGQGFPGHLAFVKLQSFPGKHGGMRWRGVSAKGEVRQMSTVSATPSPVSRNGRRDIANRAEETARSKRISALSAHRMPLSVQDVFG